MQREVRTLGRNDRLGIADKVMKDERIRHLPVIDEDGLVCAVVSQRDLFRGALLRSLGYGSSAEDRLLNQIMVKEAMSNNLYTTTPDTPIEDAARLMLDHKVGCLPVIKDEKLVGILTESDLVRFVANGEAAAT
jgi:CBS domain-containing membrane protein